MSPDEILKFLRLTYTALSDGALLALIALALVLIYKATDVVNFANGEFMMIGGYIGYQLLVWLQVIESPGLAVLLAIVGVVALTTLIGVLVERLVLRPLIGEPIISVIMVTIGLSNVMQAIVGLLWGKNPRPLPIPVIPRFDPLRIELEGARRPLNLSPDTVIIVIVVFVLVGGLLLFFRRSKQGIAMRATADDQQAAMSMGISIRAIFALTWSLAAMAAAVAGLMIAHVTNGVSGDIPGVGLRAFPVIILGGLDSIGGAILGGFVIAFVETFASGYIDPSLKTVAPYLVLLLVLMVKPYGLFGQKRIERV
jgi:branched-chain amino acid transport system permease protein